MYKLESSWGTALINIPWECIDKKHPQGQYWSKTNHQNVCNQKILKETVQQRSQNLSWARKKSSNLSSGSHCQAASGASEWRWGPPAYSRYSKETFFTFFCLLKMMQPVLPYQIYSRALEECYTEEEWAQEQCPTEREVFHNSLPSILLYREYPQYIIVCSRLHIYCADIWSLHICCVDCRYSRQQLPRWGRHPASAFWHFPPNFPPDFRRMSCRTSSPELAARAPQRLQPAATWYSRKLHLETGKEYKHNYRICITDASNQIWESLSAGYHWSEKCSCNSLCVKNTSFHVHGGDKLCSLLTIVNLSGPLL